MLFTLEHSQPNFPLTMKSDKTIKVRVTHDEYLTLMKRSTRLRLATWMREHCLGLTALPTAEQEEPLLHRLSNIECELQHLLPQVRNDDKEILTKIHNEISTLILSHLASEEHVPVEAYDALSSKSPRAYSPETAPLDMDTKYD